MDNLNSKKFIFAVVVVALSAVLLYTSHISSAEFKELVELVFGVFVMGNVVSKFSEK